MVARPTPRPERPAGAVAALAAILAGAVVLRLPLLVSSRFFFNSDEAANALLIKHLVEGRELTIYPWDASYYGIVEGLLALPFLPFFGWQPVAFKLGAVAGFLALVVAVYLLGRRLFGVPAGLAAAAVAAAFSPDVARWSTMATGGALLIVAWGGLAVLLIDAATRAPSPGRLVAAGLACGLGLYIYELFLVFLAAIAVWLPLALLVRGLPRREARARWLGGALAVGAGFALGVAPKLALAAFGSMGTKRPAYGLADAGRVAANLRLLAAESLPTLFGVNPARHPALAGVVGVDGPLMAALGGLLLLVWAGIAVWAVVAAGRDLVDLAGARAERRAPILSLLVLLVPVALALFALSPNPEGIVSTRYLFPTLAALPVLAGGALARLGRRSRPAATAAAALLVLVPAAQVVTWQQDLGCLGPDLVPTPLPEPLDGVVRYLERQGIEGAYGSYWTAYEATFLAGERLIVTPYGEWDRYPPYTRRVDALDRAAHIHLVGLQAGGSDAQHALFRERLESVGAPWRAVRIGPYLVYHGPRGERVLPPLGSSPPVPLADPRAGIELGRVPEAVAAGSSFEVPVRLTNASDGVWSPTGLVMQAGTLRVAASYRWFDAAGASIEPNGLRSLLPTEVLPGESLDMVVDVRAPQVPPGSYELAITLVQENVAWFDHATGSISRRVPVAVR